MKLLLASWIDRLYENFVTPTLRILFLVGLVVLVGYLIFYIVSKIRKESALPSRQSLSRENARLEAEIRRLESELREKEHTSAPSDTTQLLNIGTLKVRADRIAYIVPQSHEQKGAGDARIKVIHYRDTSLTDSVYSNFDAILAQLPGDFMLINKNQIVNLREVIKVQGMEVFLNGIRTPFYISDQKKDEFDIRMAHTRD